ncbi:hypothetical protein [Parasitella parasitica]|uniref:Uncharacterized protein n=1 Tax=Parasitella parasitica TaxID=35722 RepID=A0A0B7NS17_9FUNG|nr:hypothetical protein [Parasitella parasitica]
MTFDLNQLQKRRKSYPPQKHITHTSNTPATCKASLSANNVPAIQIDSGIQPLTEENLAIHTRTVRKLQGVHIQMYANITFKKFLPSKDARRRNCQIFVESQISVVALEMKLQQQREIEISKLETQEPENIHFVNPFHDSNKPLEGERSHRSKWFNKLKHWIRFDSRTKQSKTRHLSWSAGTEKEDHKMVDSTTCQKRDSGISIFSSNHSKRPLSAIPISRQPKFSPPNDTRNVDLITYQYPKIRRKSSMGHSVSVATPAAAPAVAGNSDDNKQNNHALEKFKSSTTSAAPIAATTTFTSAIATTSSHYPDQQQSFLKSH